MTLKEFGILILSIIAVLLFALNYPIAEYFANWDVDPDKNLAIRFNIYAVIMALCFILTQFKHSNWSKFVLSIGVGICISDVLDRFIFDVTCFQWNDIFMIIITVLTSYYKNIYVRQRR